MESTSPSQFDVVKVQNETLEQLTKNCLTAAAEIKVLKDVINSQHNEIQELKAEQKQLKKYIHTQELRNALSFAEKEYQDIVRVHNEERSRESDWNYGAPKKENEERRRKIEEPYKQRILDLTQQIEEWFQQIGLE